MFLKIEGVDGESADSDHKDWIEVLSFSQSVSKPVTWSGTGRYSGGTTFKEITTRKWIDKASPILMSSVCGGKVFPKVELQVRRDSLGTPNNQTYFTYTLSDVLISSASMSGSSGETERPTESVSFNFTKIEMKYQEVDKLTGATVFGTNATCTVGNSTP